MSGKQQVRHRLILQILNDHREHKIEELVERTGVSLNTVRRDLDYLDSENLVVRTNGGARALSAVGFRPAYGERVHRYATEKRALAVEALKYINPRDTIALCNGSTVAYLSQAIGESGIEVTVITNSFDSAFRLATYPKVHCILIGGEVTEEYTISGHWGAQMLERLPGVDKTFLSCDGIHIGHGLTSYLPTDATIHGIMASKAKEVIALIDYSKFGVVKLSPIIPLSKVDIAIVDSGLARETADEFRANGLNLIVADLNLTEKQERLFSW